MTVKWLGDKIPTPPPDVIEAVEKIEEFLEKSDAPANRVNVEKEAFTMSDRPGQGHDPHPTAAISERDQIEARMATIENEDAAAFDRWFASLPEAERQAQKPRESARGRAARLMDGNAEYKQLASRLSALTTAGVPTRKLAKADEPAFSQGVVADMINAEIDRLVGVSKSDPTYYKKRVAAWAANPHLRRRYEEHRAGAAV